MNGMHNEAGSIAVYRVELCDFWAHEGPRPFALTSPTQLRAVLMFRLWVGVIGGDDDE